MSEIEELKKQKDLAYQERNMLVSFISKLFESSLERHPDEDKSWEDDWRWIVFIKLPTGQASWHIHDSELHLFDHLKRNEGITWDGHTTKEKYDRILNFKKYPSYCCQNCGVMIGWLGRFFQWIPGFHRFKDCKKEQKQ